MHAPRAVTEAYNRFAAKARHEAGQQMTEAWNTPPTTKDRQVPLGKAYERATSDAARADLISAMKADLGHLH